ALRAELSIDGIDVHVIYPGSVATNVSRNALTADGSERGRSDSIIDNGISADEAARTMLDAVDAGEREIIIAEGMERVIGEARRPYRDRHASRTWWRHGAGAVALRSSRPSSGVTHRHGQRTRFAERRIRNR